MAGLNISKYRPDYGSHIPALIKALDLTNGPVLELGIGPFSTPLLHMLCKDQDRLLVSYEDKKSYVDAHKDFQSSGHQIHFVEDWDKAGNECDSWGVVFIDHAGDRRAIDAIRFANKAAVVVLHDSNSRYEEQYHYSTVYPHFEHRYIYDKIHPHTTILSNFIYLVHL